MPSLARATWRTLLTAVSIALLASSLVVTPTAAAGSVGFSTVLSGYSHPVLVTAPRGSSRRIFIVEQTGRIRVATYSGGRWRKEGTFLDIHDRVRYGGEQGLLGLAFDPGYASNGRFYVNYTRRPDGDTVVEEYRRSSSTHASRSSARRVMRINQPYANHNGGMIAFGPDGYLWIGTGDGGSAGDPWDHARDPGSRLGKMLRIDVSSHPYRVPADNPFLGRRGAAPEVWALGLRNPWRFSFDRESGELWIGDVGQGAWEEIDVEDPKQGGGRHYGWRTMEGNHCFDPRRGCDTTGLTPPVHEYGHDLGCSVTGGYVYRGRAIPDLAGRYLFSDYCRGTIWSLERSAGDPARVQVLVESRRPVSSFGEGPDGELYLCDHQGAVLRIEPAG